MQDGLTEECPVPPVHLYIEPTNACNLECPFCDTYGSRPIKFMDIGTFGKIIDDLIKHSYLILFSNSLIGFLEYSLCRILFSNQFPLQIYCYPRLYVASQTI